MNTNFRQQARDALSRAKDELASDSFERLKYAALELRMAMECLTYERAKTYARELPPTEYETWQPKKLMMLLLEIDPRADKDSSIAYGVEDVPGKEAEVMTSLGAEKVLNLSTIKKHYDALGSYLHTPTIRQLESGASIDFKKLRSRCEQIVRAVEATLASPVWNINFGKFSEIPCMRCNHLVRKRMNGPNEIARCFECGATYEVNETPAKQINWRMIKQLIPCQASGCGKDIVLIDADIEAGKAVRCPHCNALHNIDLMIRLGEDSTSPAQTSPPQNR
jgi:DNA-directed RNA polymerase subunit RPC12/RpoP